MKIHVFQHVAFEGPARIVDWAAAKNAIIEITRFYEKGWSLPESPPDLLVVMGGPMSVGDGDQYPWLNQEKAYIGQCIRERVKVLGVCLGAQLAAEALGAHVYPNAQKEIGWFKVYRTSVPHPILGRVPQDVMAFHWHGDTFDLPSSAMQLAHSDVTSHQAFLWNEQVLGLQYHLEMGPEDIEALIKNCGDELKQGGKYIQSEAEIRAGFKHAEDNIGILNFMLNRFV